MICVKKVSVSGSMYVYDISLWSIGKRSVQIIGTGIIPFVVCTNEPCHLERIAVCINLCLHGLYM